VGICRTLPVFAALAVAATRSEPLRAREPVEVPNLAGKILTVTGPIDPADVGPTMMHEHIFIARLPATVKMARPASDLALCDQTITFRNLSAFRYYSTFPDRDCRNNFFDLTDVNDAITEVSEFKRQGGRTLVDVSNIGLGRDASGLAAVARATGLNIIMGAGWYQRLFHPPDMDQKTVEDLTEVMILDITVGVDGTAVRSGVIGEVGVVGNPLTANEMKSIRATGRAARVTGAPISFHGGGHKHEKVAVLDTLVAEGVDPTRVVFGHAKGILDDEALMRRLLDRGAYLEFDTLGYSEALARSRLGSTDDFGVAQGILKLIRAGYGDRILLSQDVCTKMQLKKYGGRGYSYVMEFFLPELRRLGATEAQIQKLVVENPRRVLTFVAPAPSVKR
jgi:phosphotriesterase-related protein